MKINKILITGSVGFIGYHLCKQLLDNGFSVFGIDNINDYYDINLKHSRLKKLKKYKEFQFEKIDISNYNDLKKIFVKLKPHIVINLAAQAGVRYSIENPFVYAKSNMLGFVNIIDLCKEFKIKKFIYASSSSVYGESENNIFSENDIINKPISLYAASKISNELIAYSYSQLFGLSTIGLRFFTVYGPYGRPDMAYFIFTDKIFNNKTIDVYNNGKMKRDFTYIDDIINGVISVLDKDFNYEIFNLGNNKSEELLDLIKIIEYKLSKKAKINFLPMQDGDVINTYADITKSKNLLSYNPLTSLKDGMDNFINWYKKYYV
tara:strand:+ start:3736 stop:4695 length:960 start_codon:yes stop_codon:yes gene_type:complete